MEIRFAFLCDAAQSSGGKLSALGIGIDRLYLSEPSNPAPPFTLVFNAIGSEQDVGTRQVSVTVRDENDEVIADFSGEFPVKSKKDAPPAMGLMVQFGNVVFPSYGQYFVVVSVDQEEMKVLPMTVSPPPVSE